MAYERFRRVHGVQLFGTYSKSRNHSPVGDALVGPREVAGMTWIAMADRRSNGSNPLAWMARIMARAVPETRNAPEIRGARVLRDRDSNPNLPDQNRASLPIGLSRTVSRPQNSQSG